MSDDKPALTAAWYREGAATTIDGETTWPDATGNGRTLFGVDLAQGPDQQAFTAIESTFDDLTTWGEAKPMTLADITAAVERQLTAPSPAWKPRVILVSPQEAAALARWRAINEQMVGTTREYQNDPSEIAEIDTSAVYEPQRYPSVVGRWTVTREQATPAPWCLTFQRAVSEDEMRQHVADYDRTRITPGANPRDCWTSSVDEREAAESPLPIFEIRNGLRPLVALQGRNARSFEEWGYEPGQVRYVPEDVRRWRNPSHRRSLHRRAREYAECAQTLVDR